MKALFLLPALFVSGCALIQPIDVTEAEAELAARTMIVGHRGNAMIVGGESQRYRGTHFATYVEHDVDPATGATETTHYVMVDDRALKCHQSDCMATIAGYHEGPAYDIAARPAPVE